MGNVRILVIEDDADINEVVCTRLTKAGFSCTPAYSGSEARLLLDRGVDSAGARGGMADGKMTVTDARTVDSADVRGSVVGNEWCAYDCIVTDLMLPGLSGERLVAELRERGAGVPIIVISARDTVADRVTLLKLGADDYLVKPFDLDELVVRVQAQLRGRGYGHGYDRGGMAQSNAGIPRSPLTRGLSAQPTGGETNPATADAVRTSLLAAGRWTLDPAAHVFAIDSQPVPLTNTEFSIIELLMAHPNTVFTKQQVYELCWNEPYMVDDNTVTAHVSKIRAKLKPSGTEMYIKTVWGLGFKLDV
ncbi:response regulator transcription factor [Bifidobacterium sp. SO4]|uniref:response regulator transcription factor n=1 Tax=Bifidobacterium sp. SO4 TaxID=2809030 RepID=UPI001BDC2787|nr:response regulator transcription factor [Bifidobacterium sp. SO4]MBT1171640.1 response regulator transcription factor [Bifidobacterium sp. SO4]